MDKKVIIDGNNFSTLDEFWDEVTRLFDWPEWFGRNMDAFEDYLWDEPADFVWINAAKSKKDLGYEATAKFWEQKYEKCPMGDVYESSKNFIKSNIKAAQERRGQTLFDTLGDCIRHWNSLIIYDACPVEFMPSVEQPER